VLTCAKCGQQNPDGFRFCGACAAPLESATEPPEERKVVTILFCDLVGFTARSERADPEDVRATLRAYHDVVRREIERFEGTVEKFIGDAVMAVFGAPVAHEDDAERAVRASLRIIEAIDEMTEEGLGARLSVRIGVNTGEAVVAAARPELGEGMVAGDVVNTAARLQQAAKPGTVVVGDLTRRITSGVIEFEPPDRIRVKGKAEPVDAWRAVAARSRFGVDVDRGPATPLIGRSRELVLLEDLHERALQESSVQLVTISGEPGVGKSRLVWEFRRVVDDRPELVTWRQGRCLSYGDGITFWALGEVVKAHAGILESDPPNEAARKLAEAVEAASEEPSQRPWLRSRLAPLVGLEPEAGGTAERAEAFAAWRAFLEGTAVQHPMVLVFEDIHWADAAMLEFIEYLVEWSTDVPLVLVCTARPELFERRPAWGGGTGDSAVIRLSPLTHQETARLVSALLDEALLPAETQAALIERSGGNPLYAEEFVRMLVDRGILVRGSRTASIIPGAEIPLPDNVQGIISARLDMLAPERKALLQDAAVVGKVFWSGALARMGDRRPDDVRDGLHELVRLELVRPTRRPSIEGEVECSFWHMLIRDVAYAQIPRATRAAKHRGVSEWIEGISGNRVADQGELLAYHDGQALELARAAGAPSPEVDDLEKRALRSSVIAGDRAMHLDVGRAASYYRRAMQLFPPGDPIRAEVRAKAAEATFLAGSIPEAVREYDRAIDELKRAGDGVRTAVAMSRLAFILRWQGQTPRAEAVTAEAAGLVEGRTASEDVVQVYLQVATNHMLSGRSRPCLEWSENALELARRFGKADQIQRALQLRGIARGDLGEYSDGIEDLRRAVDMCLEAGLGHDTYRSKGNLADFLWVVEGPEVGLATMREGIAWAEEHGQAGPAHWGKAESLWMLLDLGRWDELLALAEEIVVWSRSFEAAYLEAIAGSFAAEALAWRGKVEDAAARIQASLPLARQIRDPQVLIPALSIAALVRSAEGDLAHAKELVDELVALILEADFTFFNFFHVTDVARIYAAADATDAAERILNLLVPRAAREEHGVISARAVLAEARGSLEEAARLYGQASEAWASFPSPLEQALALLGAGRCRLGLGGDPEEDLWLAREIFSGLGARPSVEQADLLLQRAIPRTS